MNLLASRSWCCLPRRRHSFSSSSVSRTLCFSARTFSTPPRATPLAASFAPLPSEKIDCSTSPIAHEKAKRQVHSGATLKFRVLPRSLLASGDQHELARLDRMLQHALVLADRREPSSAAEDARRTSRGTFVVCAAAVDTPTQSASCFPSPSPVCPCPSLTGVNYAYHSCVNPPNGTLKGILKGCAEQNALGAVAAQGIAYSSLARVYLASVHCGEANVERCTLPFPCPECWHKLLRVSQFRVQEGLAPLQMFLRAPSHREHMLRIMEKAQQEVEACQTDIHVTLVVK